MSDNKALAERLLAETLGAEVAVVQRYRAEADTHVSVGEALQAIERALTQQPSPQADKARGEVVAWMVTRECDPSFPRLFTKEADADLWIARVQLYPFAEKVPLYTAPQPQGDASGLDKRIADEMAAKEKQCGVSGCTNQATHTWSGHPTCDDCGTPGRMQRPNGGISLGYRCTLEAVEHGGILIRTAPFPAAQKERK